MRTDKGGGWDEGNLCWRKSESIACLPVSKKRLGGLKGTSVFCFVSFFLSFVVFALPHRAKGRSNSIFAAANCLVAKGWTVQAGSRQQVKSALLLQAEAPA